MTVAGPDAATYLQGQLSQDVAGLAVGERRRRRSCWRPQGKVDGWGRVHRTADDAFEIDVDAGAGEAWVARLQPVPAADQGRDHASTAACARWPCAARPVAPIGRPRPRGSAAPAPTWLDVLEPDEAAADGRARRCRRGRRATALEAPAHPRRRAPHGGASSTATPSRPPSASGSSTASVSFTKGCYTGQELVARIDSRGGNVPRHLMGVVIDGPPPAPGTVITVDGAPAGAITSAALDGAAGSSVALAFVPRSIEVGPDGIEAEVAGIPARLVALPIA